MYLSTHQATKKLGISSDTLRRWLKQGKITAKTSPSGTRLYNISYIFPELTSQNVETTPPPPPPPKKDILAITLSLSIECKEKELPYIDENVKTGEVSRKMKASAIRARTKRKRSEVTLNRTLQVKVYPNHSQKQLLKRWMGLARFAYSSVVKWSKSDIQAGINVDKVNDKKLINSAIWAIDEALTARNEVIKRNIQHAQSESVSSLSFRTRKDLQQTVTIRAQNFSSTVFINKRALWTLHFEKKRKNNKWPIPHKISCDSKFTYFRQTNEWKLAWVYETQKLFCETQAGVRVVSIDPGVRTPFT
ncbi:unnamed protein product [Rhizophagus irregularis]|nr:unnamed protein product [Rhizophagus irregularis]